MAAPFPPQGQQQQYTERPLKVYGEQYLEGAPLPIGVVIIDPAGPMPVFVDGLPRVFLPTGPVVVHVTDWVISNRYSGTPIDVVSAEEFTERFGAGAQPLPAGSS
jgi:hypothetical protein